LKVDLTGHSLLVRMLSEAAVCSLYLDLSGLMKESSPKRLTRLGSQPPL